MEEDTAPIEEAVAAFNEAFEEYAYEFVPTYWARTRRNLGTALLALGVLKNGNIRLEEAVSAS